MQTAPTNVVIQIRIDSPGDNGAVTQTITTAAAQEAAPAAAPASVQAPDPAPAATVAAQAAPANVDLSLRMASPGQNGESTQAITATATQYQPAAAAAPAAAPSPDPAPASPAPGGAATPAATATPTAAAGLPSSWTWNWTCGDIGPGDIASTSDITSQGWIWNWNLGRDCGGIYAGNPNRQTSSVRKSTADIVVAPAAPEIVLPAPPTPPVLRMPAPPVPPAPVLEPGALAHRPQVVIARVAPLQPLDSSGAAPTPARAGRPARARPHAERHAQHPRVRLETVGSPVEPPAVSSRHAATHPPTAPPRPSPTSRPVRTLPSAAGLDVASAGSGGAAGAGAGSGSGGGSTAVTAALALWLLLLLPALAVMRLPRSRRGPDAQVDDVLTRPG